MNINRAIHCSEDVLLYPIGLYSTIGNKFGEELRKTGEFEKYYGIKESEDKYSLINLCRPLFYEIKVKYENEPYISAGYIGLNVLQDVCDLEIYIFQKYRRKGIGKIAVKALLEKLTAKEIKVFDTKNLKKVIYEPQKVTADVRIDNEASKALVISCGFKRNEDIAVQFASSIDEDDDLADMVEVIPYEIELSKELD